MEMIQLMGTPSVNRQAFGPVGMTTDQAAVSENSLAEFGDVLNAALSGGQEKEVNLDELIAQLVGLDLLPGMKPNHGMEGGTPQFDLSWGRIEAAARGALSDAVISESASQFELSFGNADVQDFTSQDVVQGLAAWLAGQKGVAQDVFSPGDQDIIVDQTPQDTVNPAATPPVAPLLSGNSRATNGSREISGTNGDRSGQFRLEPGLRFDPSSDDVLGEANGTKKGFQGTGQGRREDGSAIGLNALSSLKQLVSAEVPPAKLEEVKEKLISLLESGKIVDPAILQRVREAIDFISGSVKIDQGVEPVSANQEKSVRSLSFEGVKASEGMDAVDVRDGKMVLSEGTNLSKGEPVKSASSDRTPQSIAVSAQDIIEGTTGRLTRESLTTQPVVAQAVAQVSRQAAPIKSASEESAQVVASEPEVTETTGTPLKTDVATKNFVKTAEQAEKLMSPQSQPLLVGQRTEANTVMVAEFVEGDEVPVLDGSGEVSREDFGMKVDSQTIDEVAGKSDVKADTAVNNARQKLVETTLDLIAARRPQSVSVQLTPQDLGTIEVSVRSLLGRVDVDLRASDEGVRQSLATQRYDLIQSIETRGATVSSMNVGAQLGQTADQSGNQGQGQLTQQDFRQAANLGQFSNGAEAPVMTPSSYAKVGSGRVDLAA